MGSATAIATAGGWTGQASLVQRLTALLSPGAAQLLIYDFSDMAYLRQDRAGATPVTAAAQNVGRVLDAGPGGYHLTAVSDPARGVFSGAGVTFNGTNTAFQTATLPAPGVDKAQVFAAAQRNSDAARATICEISGSIGVLGLEAPTGAASNFGFGHQGANGTRRIRALTTAAAPVSAVVSGLSDFATPAVSIRVGGTASTENTDATGGGNYNPAGTSRLDVGARSGSSLFFNGDTALLIVRFGPNLDAGVIAAVEALLAPKAEALT